jgi:hypothetical protein
MHGEIFTAEIAENAEEEVSRFYVNPFGDLGVLGGERGS